MGRRSKQLVKNRAKTHRARVRKARAKRVRARARGLHPASKRRRLCAQRRQGRKTRMR